MNKTVLTDLPKGFFPVRISVMGYEDGEIAGENTLNTTHTPLLLIERFIEKVRDMYKIAILNHPIIKETKGAEAIIAVPFSERERIRIDYNIYASEIDEEVGNRLRYEFHMESAFPD